MKVKIFIIIILLAVAFGAGIYFKDSAINLYNNFGKKVNDFKKSQVGVLVGQITQSIINPPPLNIGRSSNQVVLLQSKIIEETNLQRKANGLPALRENSILDKAASAKAADMFAKQYFEHTSPTGVGTAELAESFQYDYILVGENLILGNFNGEKEVVGDWMNSEGHRANILNNRYTEIGVAVVKGTYKGETVWIGVQEFGLPASACTRPSLASKDEIDSLNSQLASMEIQLTAKKQQIEGSRNSAGYNQMIKEYNQLVDEYEVLAQTVKNLVNQYNQQANIFNNCVKGI